MAVEGKPSSEAHDFITIEMIRSDGVTVRKMLGGVGSTMHAMKFSTRQKTADSICVAIFRAR